MQIIGMLEAFPFTHNNSLQLPQNTKNKGIKQSPASVRLKESSSKRDQINNEDNQKEFSECHKHGYFVYDYDCNNYIANQKIFPIRVRVRNCCEMIWIKHSLPISSRQLG